MPHGADVIQGVSHMLSGGPHCEVCMVCVKKVCTRFFFSDMEREFLCTPFISCTPCTLHSGAHLMTHSNGQNTQESPKIHRSDFFMLIQIYMRDMSISHLTIRAKAGILKFKLLALDMNVRASTLPFIVR